VCRHDWHATVGVVPAHPARPARSAPPPYLTVARTVEAQVEVRRSRFLAHLERVDTEGAARAVVERARKDHWDARHHCSAFRLGAGASQVQRSSDDGEPSGTAGAPILDVLIGQGLSDVVVVVTRWFGGTLLGTGGLIRAYADVTRAAVGAATVLRREPRRLVSLTVDAADAGRVEHAVRAAGHRVTAKTYGIERATMALALDEPAIANLRALCQALTSGQARLTLGELTWVDTPSPAPGRA
jgi:uncharacterized YigZ family protein